MDKWRLELAQIKREFEKGAFKERVGGSLVENPTCLDNDFCNNAPTQSTDGVLTMAFVNMQPLSTVYSASDAMKKGTLFPNIDKPFSKGRRI